MASKLHMAGMYRLIFGEKVESEHREKYTKYFAKISVKTKALLSAVKTLYLDLHIARPPASSIFGFIEV